MSAYKSEWDGKVLHVHGARSRNLWHEVAHWLLCEPELRIYSGFGLGELYGQGKEPRTSEVKEVTASALGIMLHWSHNVDGAVLHARTHNWDSLPEHIWQDLVYEINKPFRPGVARAINALLDIGVVYLGQGTNTYVLRHMEE